MSDREYVEKRIRQHQELLEAGSAVVCKGQPIYSGNDETALEYVVDAKEFDRLVNAVHALSVEVK